ncbi:MAG: SulP family inorganic anion transporter [Methylococcaceae bacterium]|nr:SulP family inorganic anion transporter [Methylococcaceae bacterium]
MTGEAAEHTGPPRGWKFPDLRDCWAGIAAAAVVIPQALAFGIALYVQVGRSPAEGALAGLFGAAALSLMSGFFGGTRGLISSPTGPTLALLTGALAHFLDAGFGQSQLGVGLAAVIICAGGMQILIALSGGGNLIKLIPHPVIAGFTTGAALLMIKSQLKPVLGDGADAAWSSWRWLPPATALLTMAAMYVCARFLPRLPATVVGLFAGVTGFMAAGHFAPAALPKAWRVGALPDLAYAHWSLNIDALGHLPPAPILFSAAALAMLASLNTLLTSVVADEATGLRHDGKRELLAQGLGQTLAGLVGGMGGSATTGASLLAIKTGGRRWVGVVAGVCFIGLLLFMGDLGNWLPLSVLAGIILYIALFMIERDIFTWLAHRHTRFDGLIALLVTLVTVVYQLVVAIGLGVAIAIVAFIYAKMKEPIIHRRTTVQQHRSIRHRGQQERDVLDAQGQRIVLYELRGSLFFAKVDQLFEQLLPDLQQAHWIILDLQRVTHVDLTGIKLFLQIGKRLNDHGGELLFSEVHKNSGMGRKVDKTLQKVSPHLGPLNIKTFVDADEALEYAENSLLKELKLTPTHCGERIELQDADLCADFTPEQVAALRGKFRSRKAVAGQHLFNMGDWGDELYLVVQGEVEIKLQTTEHHYLRLAIYGPGSLLGEIAFIAPGPRTATGSATCPTELLVLDRSSFDQLASQNPDVAIALLLALAQSMGNSLRWSVAEIHHLAQW